MVIKWQWNEQYDANGTQIVSPFHVNMSIACAIYCDAWMFPASGTSSITRRYFDLTSVADRKLHFTIGD